MADSVSTFRAVCRGGLNTGADVLSLGEESPGSAIQLLNYEPNLEGGYRRLTGFANNFITSSVAFECVIWSLVSGESSLIPTLPAFVIRSLLVVAV